MLAPDIDGTKDCLQESSNAAQAVTQYAQAMVTLVPAYFSALTGSWENLQPTLQAVINHAQQWPQTLCASYTNDVPTLFINYNQTFQANVGTLIQQEQILRNDPTNIAAQYALTCGLKVLLQAQQALEKPLTALEPNIISFENLLQADHTTMDQIVGQLASSVPGGSTVIDNVQSSLQVTFFSSNMLGPCNAIVEMATTVAVQLRVALQSAPPVVPTVLLQTLLEQMEPQNEAATRALSDVLQVWDTLTIKLEAVIMQLQQAEAEQIGSILQQLDLQAAALSWQQLATFAQTLVPAEETHYA